MCTEIFNPCGIDFDITGVLMGPEMNYYIQNFPISHFVLHFVNPSWKPKHPC